MAGSGDIDLSNTNPGFANPGGTTAASYVLATGSSELTAGYNASSLFTYDFNNKTRPSSGAWSMGAFAAPTSGDLVQETYNDPSTSPTTISQAFGASQTAGDLNVVVIGYNSTTATVSSVTDSAGNTYTKAIGPTVGSLATQYIYYAPSIKAGSNTVTVNFSAAVNYPDLRIAEYKNVGALDKTAGASGNSASPNSGSVTTTSANEVLVGACNSGPGVTGAGSGYTDLVITSPDEDAIEDDTVTSTGSYSATVTQNSGNWVMQIATFMAAGSPPGTPTLNSATAGNGSVALAWATDSGATSYSIYRGTSSGGENSTAIGSTSGTSYTDSTVTNGITYYYKIKASNSYGVSGYSNEKSARPVAPIAFKQVNSNDPTSGTTVTCAYSSAQTAGDMNIVVVGCNSPGTAINSVTDSAGNTYQVAVGLTSQTSGVEQAIYYCPNIKAASSNTVTVTFAASVAYPDIRVLEYSGVYALDKTSTGQGTTTTTSATTSSVTTTQARELLFEADTCFPVSTTASPWTTRITTTDGNIAADRTVSSTGSYSGAATLANKNYWVLQMITLY